jgi:hypothetical protein
MNKRKRNTGTMRYFPLQSCEITQMVIPVLYMTELGLREVREAIQNNAVKTWR